MLAPPRGSLGPRGRHSPLPPHPAPALCSTGVVVARVEPRRSRVLMGVWTQRGLGAGVLPQLSLHLRTVLSGSEPAGLWRSPPPPSCPPLLPRGSQPGRRAAHLFYSFRGLRLVRSAWLWVGGWSSGGVPGMGHSLRSSPRPGCYEWPLWDAVPRQRWTPRVTGQGLAFGGPRAQADEPHTSRVA